MKNHWLISVYLCAFALTGCRDENGVSDQSFHYNYFPTDSGHYVIYEVDSIIYTYAAPQQFRDTIRYQWMEMITDTFYDNQNRLNQRLECFKRYQPTDPWMVDRVWHIYRNSTDAQKVEDDIRFIKMVFPPAANKEWNGNLYTPNTSQFSFLNDWSYRYEDVHHQFVLNGQVFDSACTVIEVNNENLVQKMLSRAVYAKNIGLVYREWERLSAGGTGVVNNWETGNMVGYRIRWRAIEWTP